MIGAEEDFVVFDVEEMVVVLLRQTETQAPVSSLCTVEVYSRRCPLQHIYENFLDV